MLSFFRPASTNFRAKRKRRLSPYTIQVCYNLHFLRKSLRTMRTLFGSGNNALFGIRCSSSNGEIEQICLVPLAKHGCKSTQFISYSCKKWGNIVHESEKTGFTDMPPRAWREVCIHYKDATHLRGGGLVIITGSPALAWQRYLSFTSSPALAWQRYLSFASGSALAWQRYLSFASGSALAWRRYLSFTSGPALAWRCYLLFTSGSALASWSC